MIRMIVGRLHVGESDRAVLDYVLSRLQNGVWEGYDAEQQAAIVWAAIGAHHENQSLYTSVMGGGR